MSRLLLLAFALVTVPLFAAEEAPEADTVSVETRASLERFLATTKTLQASFTQALFEDGSERDALDRSEGTVTLERPGRFRWNYTTPYEKVVAADGARLWIYEADLDQVIVRPAADAIAANPASLLSGQAELDEAFRVLRAFRAGEVDWLELEPRAKDNNFGTVRLGLNGGVLSVMELVDNLGQVTRIAFSDVVVNAAVSDGALDFVPPDGVDVVELGN
ncbi:MAG: outer membrane lipoprotein chaperone LolA [Pseudomonadota bacterium]